MSKLDEKIRHEQTSWKRNKIYTNYNFKIMDIFIKHFKPKSRLKHQDKYNDLKVIRVGQTTTNE